MKMCVVQLPELPDKGDLHDFIEQHDSTDSDDLKRYIDSLANQADIYQPRTPMVVEVQNETAISNATVKHTELGLAERLVEIHGADLRYCHALGWLVWNGKQWLQDKTGVVERKTIDAIRSLHKIASNIEDKSDRRALQSFANKAETNSRIKAIISLAQCLSGVAITIDQLDSDPWLLNVTNGTVDLQTGKLLPHNREHLITKIAGAAYLPDARSETFDQFLADILPDEAMRSFAQLSIGSSLAGVVRDHVLNVLYGGGRNGKSTLINAMLATLGDYGMNAPPKLLMTSKYSQHPTELADLRGMRFVSCMESGEGARLDEELVKRLTGGDWIKARLMRQDFFQFPPTHTFFVGTNHKPTIRGNDDAIWERVKLWPFTQQFKKPNVDLKLGEKLQQACDAILCWAVDGCFKWQSDGLNEPEAVKVETDKYRQESDVLGRFLVDCCIVAPNAKVAAKDVYDAYKAWADSSGEHVLSLTSFGKKIQERGFEKKKHGAAGRIHYFGLGILENITSKNTINTEQSEHLSI